MEVVPVCSLDGIVDIEISIPPITTPLARLRPLPSRAISIERRLHQLEEIRFQNGIDQLIAEFRGDGFPNSWVGTAEHFQEMWATRNNVFGIQSILLRPGWEEQEFASPPWRRPAQLHVGWDHTAPGQEGAWREASVASLLHTPGLSSEEIVWIHHILHGEVGNSVGYFIHYLLKVCYPVCPCLSISGAVKRRMAPLTRRLT